MPSFVGELVDPALPPRLCYEFQAHVHQHVVVKQDHEDDVVDTAKYVMRVSRDQDVVGILEDDEVAGKEFQSFYTGVGGRCINLELKTFFDERICDAFTAAAPAHKKEACSTRELKKQVPLDSSFAHPSVEYTRASLVASRAKAGAPTHARTEEWAFAPSVQALNFTEMGVPFNASVWLHVTFEVDVEDAEKELTGPVTVLADARGCAGLARLSHVHSELTTKVVCLADEATCKAAGVETAQTLRTVTSTRLTYLRGDDARGEGEGRLAMPPLASCFDGTTEDAPPTYGDDGGYDETATHADGRGALAWRSGTIERDRPRASTAAVEWLIDGTGLSDGAEPPPFASWLAPPRRLAFGAVNQPLRIAAINAEHDLGWWAGTSDYMDGQSFLTLRRALGTRGLGRRARSRTRGQRSPLALQQDQDAHQDARKASSSSGLPKSFDARDKWPACAEVIGAVRNQGGCGSCWAFASIETLADRHCIRSGGAAKPRLSAQSLMNCDPHDGGCNGGWIDNAWRFLQAHGVQEEGCIPYRYCPNPAMPNCSIERTHIDDFMTSPPAPSARTARGGIAGATAAAESAPPWPISHASPPPDMPGSRGSCQRCEDGSAGALWRSESAYAVAEAGDAEGMQREIWTNGPIAVGYFVYSDFAQYKGGVYRRSEHAWGPIGGHAVKLVGWGEDEDGRPYWTAVNSWSVQWGEAGFFRIARGINECSIEETPAAGLAAAGN